MLHQKLIDRLLAVTNLSAGDLNLLADMPTTVKSYSDGAYILRDGDKSSHCCLLLEGFLARHKIAGDRSQILSFHVPGDIPDIQTLHLNVMDHDLTSVGRSVVGFISHDWFSRTLDHSPSLAHVFWRETLIDAAVYREWIANIGARDALARIAHLICEIEARLAVVGLVNGNSFNVPFTQRSLADACGLSNVHVNRTLQELRTRGLIVWEGRTVTILKRNDLESVGDFQRNYLHLKH
jgi:CRP-like cAMP-binding protein